MSGWLLPVVMAARVHAAPCTVQLLEPADGAIASNAPTFTWSGDCVGYRITFSATGDFGDAVGPRPAVRTSFTPGETVWEAMQAGPFAQGGWWRVSGQAADGTVTVSKARSIGMDPDMDDDGVSIGDGDCDDADPEVHPGATEICNGVDDDCSGTADDGLTQDVDGDGFTAPGSCEGSGDDCDDRDAAVWPGAAEVCNGIDDDCSGEADDGLTWDLDGDGLTALGSCEGSADDCDDADASIGDEGGTCSIATVIRFDQGVSLREATVGASGLEVRPDTAAFTGSGTFVVPDGVTELTVYALAAGGGGGEGFAGQRSGGGGGATRGTFAVTPGASIPVTVGLGGAGWTSGASPATDGGSSSVVMGDVTLVGGGGSGGSGGGAGGVASGGEVNVPGADGVDTGRPGNAGSDIDGVCSAGSGGAAVDAGVDNDYLGGPGGCSPAGEGGEGPPQWGYVDVGDGSYWSSMGAWVKQPGGDGASYGGGGGTGGNYDSAGGRGADGYVLFAWTSEAPVYPAGTLGTAVTTDAGQVDTSTWAGLASVTPDESTAGGTATYAVSFDGRSSFWVHAGSTWRPITRQVPSNANDPTSSQRWQLNVDAAEGGETWVDCASNATDGCLQEAMGWAVDQMDGTTLAALQPDDWAAVFVPGTFDLAVGVTASTLSASAAVASVTVVAR